MISKHTEPTALFILSPKERKGSNLELTGKPAARRKEGERWGGQWGCHTEVLCCVAGLVREVAVSVMVCMEQGLVLGLLSSGLHSFWISPSVCPGFPCEIKNAVDFFLFLFLK